MFFELEQITPLLMQYGYLILFPLIVVEGPIATIIAGFLSSLGYFNFYVLLAVVVIGDLVGDIGHYAAGRWGREKFIKRWGHYLGVTPEKVQQIEKHFLEHGARNLFVGKVAHGFGEIVLMAAGIAKMPLWQFIWYNFVATVPKSLLLLLIGFYFGQSYNQFDSYLNITALVTFAIGSLLTLVYIMIKAKAKKLEYKK